MKDPDCLKTEKTYLSMDETNPDQLAHMCGDSFENEGTERDILVLIRGGRYYLRNAVVFSLEDSAPEGYTISYRAYSPYAPERDLSNRRKASVFQFR